MDTGGNDKIRYWILFTTAATIRRAASAGVLRSASEGIIALETKDGKEPLIVQTVALRTLHLFRRPQNQLFKIFVTALTVEFINRHGNPAFQKKICLERQTLFIWCLCSPSSFLSPKERPWEVPCLHGSFPWTSHLHGRFLLGSPMIFRTMILLPSTLFVLADLEVPAQR